MLLGERCVRLPIKQKRGSVDEGRLLWTVHSIHSHIYRTPIIIESVISMFSAVNHPIINAHRLSHYQFVYYSLELEDCPVQLGLALKQDAANAYINELEPTITHIMGSLEMQVE